MEPNETSEPARRQFAERVLRVVQQTAPGKAWIDEENFAINHMADGDTEPHLMYLRNTFLECQGAPPDEVTERINRLVSVIALAEEDGLDTWEEVRHQLRPVIRAATYGLMADHRLAGLSRPVLPYLEEMVVIDTPTAMRYVTDASPAGWGVTPEEVYATAHANLAAMAPAPEPNGGRPSVVRFVDETGDFYLSSLPLLDGWLVSMADAVGGRPVAFMPEHAALVLAADGEAIPGVLAMVGEEYLEAPRSLSPMAYTVDDTGAVTPYRVPDGHPAEMAVRRAEALLAATEYQAQKEHLDQQHEADGVDLFVASLMHAERPDGAVLTVTTWGDGVEALLPRAEYVTFVSEDSEPFLVPWPVVAEWVPLPPEPDMNPPRYRVSDWPAADVIAQLRARAVERPD